MHAELVTAGARPHAVMLNCHVVHHNQAQSLALICRSGKPSFKSEELKDTTHKNNQDAA